MAYQVFRAHSLTELWKIFADHPDAYPIAGGTDIIPRVNQGIESHSLFVCLEGISELGGIEFLPDGSLQIGALTKLVDIAESAQLSGYRALQQACTRVASPQIRNQATIGGNVLQENRCVYFNQSVSWRREDSCFKLGGNRCYQYLRSPHCVALLQSDVAPVLMSYHAVAYWQSPRGARQTPLAELYLDDGKKAKERDEVLTALVIPPRDGILKSAYARETIRGSFDFPIISCAIALTEQNGRIAKATVVIGSAGVKPQYVDDVEPLLQGKTTEEAMLLVDEVQKMAVKKIAPFRDSRVDAAARKALGKSVIKRALFQVCA
jgi:4-hydroxybenzoyl-CoA reductase subunit beta